MKKIDSTAALTALDAQTRQSKKYFSKKGCIAAMIAVIEESAKDPDVRSGTENYVKAGISAQLCVHFQDEIKRARKEGAREGYLDLLRDLEVVAASRVNKYCPDSNYVQRTWPRASARFVTPQMVLDAQAAIEIAERIEARKKGATRGKVGTSGRRAAAA